jgi:retron-type reverse transcriptase
MRLRAQIVIDIDADDFTEAADHQLRLERLFHVIRDEYVQAQWEFRQRRQRSLRNGPAIDGPHHYTGRMAEYEK